MRQESLAEKRMLLLIVACIAVAIAFAAIQPMFASAAVRFALACAFQALILGLLALAMARAARRWMNELALVRRDYMRIAVVTVLFAAAGAVFLHLFFRADRDIKAYDFSMYWIGVIEDRQLIANSIVDYALSLGRTLQEDYSRLAVFPLLLISYITGIDYGGYCQSILLVYYIPACFFITLFALRLNRLASNRKPGAATYALCFGISALSVGFFWPMLNGYLDVSVVLFMGLLLNVTMRWDILAWNWKKNVTVALLCLFAVLFRRWFAIYVVGFFLSFGLLALVQAGRNRELTGQRIGQFLLNIASIVALSSLLILLVNPGMFTSLLGRNYAVEYAAYRRLSIGENLLQFVTSNGIFWVLLALVGMLMLLRNQATRAIALRLLVAMLLSVVLFSLIQNLDYHHYYLILPTLTIFICGLAENAIQYAIRQEKPIWVITVLAICTINFPLSFYQPLEAFSWITEPFTAGMHHYPRQMGNYDIARLVASDLRQISDPRPEYTYVIGDQPLNNEVIKRSYLPDMVDAAPYALHQHQVDLRDGFPSKAFFADYLLVNKPYQSEFSQYQQVNYQLYDLIANDGLAAKYYAVDSVYPTSLGETVLYRKIRSADAALVNALKDRLIAYYPDNPFVYWPNYFLTLFEVSETTDYMFNQWTNEFTLSKAEGEPVSFRINDTADFTALTFDLVSDVPGLSLTVENQDGMLSTAQIARMGGETFAFDIAGSDFITVTIAEDGESAPIETTLRLNSTFESLS